MALSGPGTELFPSTFNSSSSASNSAFLTVTTSETEPAPIMVTAIPSAEAPPLDCTLISLGAIFKSVLNFHLPSDLTFAVPTTVPPSTVDPR